MARPAETLKREDAVAIARLTVLEDASFDEDTAQAIIFGERTVDAKDDGDGGGGNASGDGVAGAGAGGDDGGDGEPSLQLLRVQRMIPGLTNRGLIADGSPGKRFGRFAASPGHLSAGRPDGKDVRIADDDADDAGAGGADAPGTAAATAAVTSSTSSTAADAGAGGAEYDLPVPRMFRVTSVSKALDTAQEVLTAEEVSAARAAALDSFVGHAGRRMADILAAMLTREAPAALQRFDMGFALFARLNDVLAGPGLGGEVPPLSTDSLSALLKLADDTRTILADYRYDNAVEVECLTGLVAWLSKPTLRLRRSAVGSTGGENADGSAQGGYTAQDRGDDIVEVEVAVDAFVGGSGAPPALPPGAPGMHLLAAALARAQCLLAWSNTLAGKGEEGEIVLFGALAAAQRAVEAAEAVASDDATAVRSARITQAFVGETQGFVCVQRGERTEGLRLVKEGIALRATLVQSLRTGAEVPSRIDAEEFGLGSGSSAPSEVPAEVIFSSLRVVELLIAARLNDEATLRAAAMRDACSASLGARHPFTSWAVVMFYDRPSGRIKREDGIIELRQAVRVYADTAGPLYTGTGSSHDTLGATMEGGRYLLEAAEQFAMAAEAFALVPSVQGKTKQARYRYNYAHCLLQDLEDRLGCFGGTQLTVGCDARPGFADEDDPGMVLPSSVLGADELIWLQQLGLDKAPAETARARLCAEPLRARLDRARKACEAAETLASTLVVDRAPIKGDSDWTQGRLRALLGDYERGIANSEAAVEVCMRLCAADIASSPTPSSGTVYRFGLRQYSLAVGYLCKRDLDRAAAVLQSATDTFQGVALATGQSSMRQWVARCKLTKALIVAHTPGPWPGELNEAAKQCEAALEEFCSACNMTYPSQMPMRGQDGQWVAAALETHGDVLMAAHRFSDAERVYRRLVTVSMAAHHRPALPGDKVGDYMERNDKSYAHVMQARLRLERAAQFRQRPAPVPVAVPATPPPAPATAGGVPPPRASAESDTKGDEEAIASAAGDAAGDAEAPSSPTSARPPGSISAPVGLDMALLLEPEPERFPDEVVEIPRLV